MNLLHARNRAQSRSRRLSWLFASTVLLAVPLAAVAAESNESNDNWPQWRGANGQGVAEGSPPVTWSEDTNIKWKVDLPGLGTSTPITWGDKIFVTTAIDTGVLGPNKVEPPKEGGRGRKVFPPNVFEWRLIALNRADGSVAWSALASKAQPHEGTHPDGTHASNSPVTDGKMVYAFFGSQGIHAYDLDGNRKWHKDLGDMTTRNGFGEGASPALHGDTLVVNWDHEGDSFVVALDKNTGDELWRRDREAERTSWSTPVIAEVGDGVQVIVSATNRVTSYDLATGKTIWETGGMTMNVIPTPMLADGVVYVTSGFRGNATMAIGLEGAAGDLTGSENIRWSYNQDTPYVPTPVLYDGLIYMLKSNKGLLSVLDAKTGELVYGIERLGNVPNVYASAFAANGHVYFLGRDGGGTVIKAGREFKVVAENQLDDRFDASPAAVGDELYVRGRKSLYCLKAAQ